MPPVLSQKVFHWAGKLPKRILALVEMLLKRCKETSVVERLHTVSGWDAKEEGVVLEERLWIMEDFVLGGFRWGMHCLEDVFGKSLREPAITSEEVIVAMPVLSAAHW